MIILAWFSTSIALWGAYYYFQVTNSTALPPLLTQVFLLLAILALAVSVNQAVQDPNEEEEDLLTRKLRGVVYRVRHRKYPNRPWLNR